MSRSYKKFPCVKDKNRGMKTMANRAIRRKRITIANGMAYKKYFCSYDISSWWDYRTYGEDIYRMNRWFMDEYKSGSYWKWFKRYKMK